MRARGNYAQGWQARLGLAGSRNAVLYAVHAVQLYSVQGLTPPIHACAVRVMNFGAETKFEKGASDRNSPLA